MNIPLSVQPLSSIALQATSWRRHMENPALDVPERNCSYIQRTSIAQWQRSGVAESDDTFVMWSDLSRTPLKGIHTDVWKNPGCSVSFLHRAALARNIFFFSRNILNVNNQTKKRMFRKVWDMFEVIQLNTFRVRSSTSFSWFSDKDFCIPISCHGGWWGFGKREKEKMDQLVIAV